MSQLQFQLWSYLLTLQFSFTGVSCYMYSTAVDGCRPSNHCVGTDRCDCHIGYRSTVAEEDRCKRLWCHWCWKARTLMYKQLGIVVSPREKIALLCSALCLQIWWANLSFVCNFCWLCCVSPIYKIYYLKDSIVCYNKLELVFADAGSTNNLDNMNPVDVFTSYKFSNRT